jgi:MFS family permease
MATPPQAIKTSANPWLVLVFLSLGFFMILLDTTIVNIAIPSIIPALHSSLDQILWVLNAYLLVYAVLLITASDASFSPAASSTTPLCGFGGERF